MKIKMLFFLFLLLFISCSKEYDEESLIQDILKNKSENVISGFYKKERLENEGFKSVIKQYSKDISNGNYEMIQYRDDFTFKSRKRLGYQFIDKNNNVVHSITYKFTTLKDGSQKINFIDFRNSEGELPCIKFPTLAPIRCLKKPFLEPVNPTQIKQDFPKMIHGRKFYHSQHFTKETLAEHGDTLKKGIVFNIGNKNVFNNFKKILDGLDSEMNLDSFSLALTAQYGEPTTNIMINYDFKFEDAKIIKSILSEKIDGNLEIVDLNSKSYRFKMPPQVLIGLVNPRCKKGYSYDQLRK
jgi:hypothetical protein